MATLEQEIHSFASMFAQLSQSGSNASLNFSSVNGQIGVSFTAELGLMQQTVPIFCDPHHGYVHPRKNRRRKQKSNAADSTRKKNTSASYLEEEIVVEIDESHDMLLLPNLTTIYGVMNYW